MQTHKDNIKSQMHEKLSSLPEDLAAQLRDTYTEQVESFNHEIRQILVVGFEMENDEVYDLLCDSESDAY